MPETTENDRILALRRYQILDTPAEGAFDRITALASQILDVPIVIASLVDTNRIWFKSHHGMNVQEIERVPGLCASAILSSEPYVLTDASTDPRSMTNPLVTGDFGLRFYAGIPLTTHDKHNLGALSLIDFKPRTITEQELDILKGLAQVVVDEMELGLVSRRMEEVNRDKSNLLAVLSHEIRTPMNGIMGMASLLHTTALNEEQKEYIETIEKSGESLLTMVDHLLDYSKMEAGKMELINQPFDIRTCVKQSCQLFAGEIAKKQLALNSEIDPAIPAVLIGDEQKIRQIIINLVGNAVKFTEQGQVDIIIRMSSLVPGQYAKVTFMVKDTGIGIDHDQFTKLFQSFTQVHADSNKLQFGGTGLGLYISKQLVELMNGRIWLEESTAAGSTFSFEIKLPLQAHA
jgi:signal transduction histidine kinase